MDNLLGHLLFSLLVLSHFHGALGRHVSHAPLSRGYGLHGIDGKAESSASPSDDSGTDFNRHSFPDGFIFGAASSAYQVEGAWNLSGKTPNIWDNYTQTYPDRTPGRVNGNVAVDSYHRYMQDVKLLNDIGMDAYRFSISWARVLPNGTLSRGVNEIGIQYYNNLIDALLKNGTVPFVTIFHFDVPQILIDDYGGFLSPEIVKDYADFANLCFERFGDRVKHWITINEPYTFSVLGYSSGDAFAPQRCSAWVNPNCTGGNSGTEPYIVTHNLLLAHARAVHLYNTNHKAQQGGKIGISLIGEWLIPFTNSSEDENATRRGLDFLIGWYLEPLVFGHYPDSMIENVGRRLPPFSDRDAMLVKGSFDFIGLNYYTARYAANDNTSYIGPNNISFANDQRVIYLWERDNKTIGSQAASDWFYIFPQGIYRLLRYVKQTYGDLIIYITENGVDGAPSVDLNPLQDSFRIQFYTDHLTNVSKAIKAGVQVKGYFGWSLMDNFEFTAGYSVRFGINFVDFKTLERYPKQSAKWFQTFLKK